MATQSGDKANRDKALCVRTLCARALVIAFALGPHLAACPGRCVSIAHECAGVASGPIGARARVCICINFRSCWGVKTAPVQS